MSRAIALTRKARIAAIEQPLELARSAIVLSCGAALVLAGQALPL
ncbi:MAG: hypothetical protein AAF494_01295 [Pseudomonadota bacterium]